ncbi:MAG: FliI/YscN family ATPase [Acidobacteria bacterium]|nr:FliI/YscN family ATPase [Acidobacteriota bacterium]
MSDQSLRIDIAPYLSHLHQIDPVRTFGRVQKAVGIVIESQGPPASVGEICEVINATGEQGVPVEVIGFREKSVLSMPLGKLQGVRLGDRIVSRRKKAMVRVGDQLLGRVIDGLGEVIDDKGGLSLPVEMPLHGIPVNPLQRNNIDEVLSTGIRALDGMLTVGKGQRVGIFGGSGVGKSTLLGMMARYTSADVNVIALVGERGREVRGFIEKDLGEEGLRRSVVVVSTSDHAPLIRIRAALTAMSIAEYFKDQGKDVLLVMDSVTRFAMAQREVGLAAGEPPSARGYTPSVFALLPQLLERAGNFASGGSITGFYTVLVEGDDMNDPVADAVRAILDGHVVLSRDLAGRNHYPSIDMLPSISRLMPDIASPEQKRAAGKVRDLLSALRKAEDLINIGAYVKGSNPKIDEALQKIDAINSYLCQDVETRVNHQQAVAQLLELGGAP